MATTTKGLIAGLAVTAVFAWLYFQQVDRANDLESRLASTRTALEDARLRLEGVSLELADLQATLDERQERFELMSFACARQINAYVLESERLVLSATAVVFGERSIAQLEDDLVGLLRQAADNDYIRRLDRAGCGMMLDQSSKFPEDDVSPVPADWRNGAEQPTL